MSLWLWNDFAVACQLPHQITYCRDIHYYGDGIGDSQHLGKHIKIKSGDISFHESFFNEKFFVTFGRSWKSWAETFDIFHVLVRLILCSAISSLKNISFSILSIRWCMVVWGRLKRRNRKLWGSKQMLGLLSSHVCRRNFQKHFKRFRILVMKMWQPASYWKCICLL